MIRSLTVLLLGLTTTACAMSFPEWLTNDTHPDAPPAAACDGAGQPWVLFAKGVGEASDLYVAHYAAGNWVWPPSPIQGADGVMAAGNYSARDLDLALDSAGRMWAIYVDKAAGAVRARYYDSAWSAEQTLDARPGCSYSCPYLATDDQGRLWAAYSRSAGLSDEEPVVRYLEETAWLPGVDSTINDPTDEPNLLHDNLLDQVSGLCSDGQGGLWLLLSSSPVDALGLPLNWDLRALRLSQGGWDWAPTPPGNDPGYIIEDSTLNQQGGGGRSLMRAGGGAMMVNWSQFPLTLSLDHALRNDPFDVYSRLYTNGGWNDPGAICPYCSPTDNAELNGTMAVDSAGRPWVAWQAWSHFSDNQFNLFASTFFGGDWQIPPGEFARRLSWERLSEFLGKGLACGVDGSTWLFWAGTRDSGTTDIRAARLGVPPLTPTPTATPTATPTPAPTVFGDLNHDGQVNRWDMMLFTRQWQLQRR